MVEIELKGDEKAALWTDGFLPKKEELQRLFVDAAGRTKHPENVRETAASADHDELFVRTLDRAYQRSKTARDYVLLDDLFYLQLGGQLGHWPGLSPIHLEYERLSKANYRALIAVYDRESSLDARKYVTRLLRDAGLVPTRSGTYRHFSSFEETTEALLKLVLDPYHGPGAAAMKNLALVGLTARPTL